MAELRRGYPSRPDQLTVLPSWLPLVSIRGGAVSLARLVLSGRCLLGILTVTGSDLRSPCPVGSRRVIGDGPEA